MTVALMIRYPRPGGHERRIRVDENPSLTRPGILSQRRAQDAPLNGDTPAKAPELCTKERSGADERFDLVRRAMTGDRGALDEVVRGVSPYMRSAIRWRLGVRAEVDDCFQESLLAFCQSLPSFRGESTVRYFATRIAVRCASCMLRDLYRRERQRDEWTKLGKPLVLTTLVPDESVLPDRRSMLLMTLLARLPRSQAQTVMLRVVLNYSARETATAMGVPENTVRSRLRLALQALRSRILLDPGFEEFLSP